MCSPTRTPAVTDALAALGIVSAALYAAGLALGAEALARTSFWLLYAEEDRYRLLARNMTDVITRHDRDGSVLFVSPAAESLFGCAIVELHEPRPVRARPRRRSSRLSHGARRHRCLGRGPFGRVPRAAREILTPTAHAATQFVWIEMRCRPLERPTAEAGNDANLEVVAVLRDVTERKRQEQALEESRSGGGARERREEPLPRHHEPRIAHAAQRHHRLLGYADEGIGADARCRTPQGICRPHQ